MTTASSTLSDYSLFATGCGRNLLAVFVLAGLGDWLFYDQPLGISIAVFFAAVGIAAATVNPLHANAREMLTALAVLVAGLAPLIAVPSLTAVLFGAMATAYAVLVMASPDRASWIARIANSFWLIADGCWQGFADIIHGLQRWMHGERGSIRTASLAAWIVPVVLGGVFLLLFTAANPLIENWFAQLYPSAGVSNFSLPRVLFWCVASLLVWPFIFMRGYSALRKNVAAEFGPAPNQAVPATPSSATLLSAATIVRSLVIFNILFAVQTVLDVVYLWGGVALPDGMSYATYAHRGAYPLIATALLAAGFVIVAMQPSSDTERSPFVRNLVYLWTGQNVLLVISSILRLDLYVAIYSLTYLRIAAFLWMVLVATGLVLIATRIAFRQSNAWLIRMNLASLGVLLYACCFVNFPKIIAEYNVTHSIEMSGDGVALDTAYLLDLGPQAIPALDRYFARQKSVPVFLVGKRDALASSEVTRLQNWRAWNYYGWQLAGYLRKPRNDAAKDSVNP
jgi:hypothetical protein